MPESACRSSWASEPRVVRIRSTCSVSPITWSLRATMVDQMYEPMFVGEVYLARVAGLRSPLMLSAGNPVAGSTMAVKERQVSVTHCTAAGGAGADAAATPEPDITSASASAPAPARARRDCRVMTTSLQAGGGDTADEVALQDDEDDQYRKHHHNRAGEQQPVARLVLPDAVQGQGDRQRVLVLGRRHHQRPQEVVPRPEEREDAEGGQRRSRGPTQEGRPGWTG